MNSTGENFFVGTCGYSYPEWKDAGFYPADTPSGRMLGEYAKKFSVTELNYTWYQMPKPGPIERMCGQVPPDFRFSAKLMRKLTHEVDPDTWKKDAAVYREGVSPMLQVGKLAAIVAQFPPSFQRVPENRKYLAALLDEMGDLPLAVEFRHVSWATEKVYAEFARRRITLVTVDVPDLPWLYPPVGVVTNPEMFYIRFHGRNAKGWRSGNMQHQFDYDYTDAELRLWAKEKISKMAQASKNGFFFFNNHVRAQAAKNAETLIKLLHN